MDPRVASLLVLIGLVQYSLSLHCVGCPMDTDIMDPTIRTRLSATLSQLKSTPSGTNNEAIALVSVNKATLQVVAGLKYSFEFQGKGLKTQTLYDCHMVVVEQLWKKTRSVLDFSCQPSSNRNKRSLLGADEEIDLESNAELPQVRTIINEELKKKFKSDYLIGVVKFHRAIKQVVAGTLTKVSVEVAPTDCLAASTKSLDNCSFQNKGHKVCHVEIWQREWLHKTDVTKFECSEEKPYYCPGCTEQLSPSDAGANQCLQRTLFNLNTRAHSTKVWHLRHILKVQRQVVAGLKYKIQFQAEDENKTEHICVAVIISQPWISEEPAVDSFECTPLTN